MPVFLCLFNSYSGDYSQGNCSVMVSPAARSDNKEELSLRILKRDVEKHPEDTGDSRLGVDGQEEERPGS